MILLVLLLAQTGAQPSATPVAADAGSKLFATSCASGYCHGAGGAPNRGPRLRGRNFERDYIERVVHDGIPNTAMPGFKSRLKPEELKLVIAYVMRISADTTAPASSDPAAAGMPAAAPTAAATPLSRGETLFFEATREPRCATCHEWKGKGIQIAALSPGASIPDRPSLIRRVTLRNKDAFAAIVMSEDAETLRTYDLTAVPPVLRSFQKSEVASVTPEPSWNHGNVTREYTDAEIKEIMRDIAAVQPPK